MDFFSTKISNDLQKDLKIKLSQDGFIISIAQNAIWKATSSGVSVTCYESLKLLVQGKNCENFISKYLKATTSTKNESTENLLNHTFESWIGTDESGKGDFIGPIVGAGVLVKKEQAEYLKSLNIKDSKKLTDKFILEIAPKIKQNCVFNVVTVNPEKYNELYLKFKNLNKLLAWIHARVIENILEKAPDCKNAISDKFADDKLIKNALGTKGKQINLIQRTKAESDIAVACASVLAREEYVKRMQKLSSIYKIQFAKGGGDMPTAQAQEFAQKYGKEKLNLICKLHFKNTDKITG